MHTRIAVVLALGLVSSAAPSAQRPPRHLLFAGRGHDVFLGCLNCASTEPASVCNSYGRFGNPFSGISIWNQFSTYGNNLNAASPWAAISVGPPVIVDDDGNFYGYLTSSELNPKRTRIRVYQLLTEAAAGGTDLGKIRDAYCQD